MLPPDLTPDQRPWLRLYDVAIPAELCARHRDALSMFRLCIAECPNAIAVWNFGRTFSYLDLEASSNSLARYMQTRGVSRGDRIAVALQNTPEFVFMCLAAWKLGAVPLPVNPMYRRPELARIFADAEPTLILCEAQDATEMADGLADAGCPQCSMIVTDARDFGLAFEFEARKAAVDDASWPRLAEIIRQHIGQIVTPTPLGADDLGLLLYTSGTTGAPKGAMITHRSLAFNAQLLATWCGLSDASRVWALAPFFHITGLVCHILACFSARAMLIMHYRFHPELALQVIRTTKPTFAIGAITAFNSLMNTPGSAREDLACFDRIYSGGAPVPPALANAFAQKFGIPIHPCYGMTETTAPTHMAPFGLRAPVDSVSGALSIGVPVPSTSAAVIDDQGRPLPPGGIGELVMRGPQVMAGYWRKPEETRAALEDGWMHSGDVGFCDAQGWFYLVDRKKDVIIASGFKVWPREVEDTLYTHSAVREAAVIGIPDGYRGESVKAYVSLIPQTRATAEDLIRHCRERLAAYKAPRSIEVLDELPKTVTGKIKRVALRDAHQQAANTIGPKPREDPDE